MIQLSRINGNKLIVNCELIQFIEATPDTLLTLSTGEKLMVKERIEDVVRLAMDYRKRLHQEPAGAR